MNLRTNKAWMLLLVLLGFVLAAGTVYAQANANLVGTVTDPTGAVVANAKITITNQDNGFVRTTTTNSTGSYSSPNIPERKLRDDGGGAWLNTFDPERIVADTLNETVRADGSCRSATLARRHGGDEPAAGPVRYQRCQPDDYGRPDRKPSYQRQKRTAADDAGTRRGLEHAGF